MSKIERGDRAASLDFCASADAVLGTGGALERLWTAGASRATATGADAAIARLRRALGTLGVGADRPYTRDLDRLSRRIGLANDMRLEARYGDLAAVVPELVMDCANAELRAAGDRERRQTAAFTTLVLRAADGLAFKLGHHDLSARLIDLMTARANATEDPAIIAAAAYVATETYFATGDLVTAHRALIAAIGRADGGTSRQERAAVGALHMRAAVVCGRLGRADQASDHLDAARDAARQTTEGIYWGTAFGPDSLRIHQLAVATELRDGAAVERAACWRPPAGLPAERRSHYFIELGRAQFDLGRYGDSRESLATARQIAPQHTRQHPQVRRIAAALRQTGSRRSRPSAFAR